MKDHRIKLTALALLLATSLSVFSACSGNNDRSKPGDNSAQSSAESKKEVISDAGGQLEDGEPDRYKQVLLVPLTELVVDVI